MPSQLRFDLQNLTAELGCEGNPRVSVGPAMDIFFLVRLQTDSTIRRLRIPSESHQCNDFSRRSWMVGSSPHPGRSLHGRADDFA